MGLAVEILLGYEELSRVVLFEIESTQRRIVLLSDLEVFRLQGLEGVRSALHLGGLVKEFPT